MSRYRQVVRFLFAGIFIGGGIAHFVMGRTMPDRYAVFGDTALIPCLGDIWDSFVMPNIGWLTILIGVFELACGIGLLFRRFISVAATLIIVFLIFITILGYGFPAAGFFSDLISNRIITIVMALLVLPLALTGMPENEATTDRP